MMLTFDLISDLHVDTWPDNNWEGIATSPMCIVAGDVAKERDQLVHTLTKLGAQYRAVFYIDGNNEHDMFLEKLGYSYADLATKVTAIPNVVYLQDNAVIIDGVAILGTNGWWSFEFNSDIDPTESAIWYQTKQKLSSTAVRTIAKMSDTDAAYLIKSVYRLQNYEEVKKIIIVTHTVPDPFLISHDISLENTHRFNMMGNQNMQQVLDADTEGKIHTWCFGHYHLDIDQIKDDIRYVNNCRGRFGTNFCKYAYYPKRISVEV
jgi:UDP-2,3-diacylglucosamine pyrophosphatase LpxH